LGNIPKAHRTNSIPARPAGGFGFCHRNTNAEKNKRAIFLLAHPKKAIFDSLMKQKIFHGHRN